MPDAAAMPVASVIDTSLEVDRAQLLADLAEAAAVPGINAAALKALRVKLNAKTFNLVVAGEFKRGKSSVINALLGAEVLPTAVVPLTSVVTVLHHGGSPSAVVQYENGACAPIDPGALADYVTERGNPRNSKHVRAVEVAYPAAWLGRGIRLIDTPGIGSAYQHNTDVTQAYLPEADAVIFVASVDQPVSRSELQFLADLRSHADRIFCLLNKIDHLSEAELAESVAFSAGTLRTALNADVPVFPVSARTAIEAGRDSGRDGFGRSGFARFDAALQQFLECDSDAVLVHSVRRHLARLLADGRLAAELELKALDAPLESLDENLRAFGARKAETLQQRSDFAALLEADARRLVRDRIEPAIAGFKHTLTQRLDALMPAWVQAAVEQHDASPQAALEQRIVAEVRSAFDAFRRQEDADAYAEFDRICARFRQHVQQVIDELMRYSAELFEVQFEPVAVEPLRDARSRFYYKFWKDPDAMGLLAETLTGTLPRALQRPLLLRRGRRRTAGLVEMQSGRMRHDFDERITHAAQLERKQMLERIDAIIAAIESAIARGRELQIGGEQTASARRREIATLLHEVERLQAPSAVAVQTESILSAVPSRD